MVTDNASTPALALEGYCELMEDWISAVRGAGDLSFDDVYPVDASATQGNADDLDGCIAFIRKNILTSWKVMLKSNGASARSQHLT